MSENTSGRSAARDCGLDNLRFFLIFTVVFAHLLEVSGTFDGREMMYQVIYSFHMPAFLFLLGYNARFSIRRIVFRWAIPYAVFQTLYIVFRNLVLKDGADFQYVVPYWILWYMLVGLFYQALLPLFDRLKGRAQGAAVFCAYVVSIASGYAPFLGYWLSLSRFFVFLPWFLLGRLIRTNGGLDRLRAGKKAAASLGALSAMGIIASAAFLKWATLPNELLYGSVSYSACGAFAWMRLAVSVCALFWMYFLFVFIRPFINKNIPLLTAIGQNTLPVFLLHGLIVKAFTLWNGAFPLSLPGVFLISAALLTLLGNRALSKAVYFIGLMWTEKLWGGV